MYRTTRLLLLARLSQIGLSLTTLAITAAVVEEWYNGDSSMSQTPLTLSVFTIVLGLFGLFSIDKHPDTDSAHDLRLHLLVLVIDSVNASTCIAIATVLGIDVSIYTYDVSASILIPAIIVNFLALFVLLALIVRSLRLWWKRMLSAGTGCSFPDKLELADRNNAEDQYAYGSPGKVPPTRRSDQSNYRSRTAELRNTMSSRPQSMLSGADTLAYQNMDQAANVGAPSRATSKATMPPSYQ